MNKTDELKALSKGYMAQKKEIKSLKEAKESLELELKSIREQQTVLARIDIEPNIDMVNRDDIKSAINKAKDYMQKSDAEKEQIGQENSALLKSIAKLSAELESITKANSQLQDENMSLREKVAYSEGDKYKELHSSSKELMQENSSLKDKISELEKNNFELNSKLKKAEKDLSNQDISNESINSDLAELTNENKALLNERDTLKLELMDLKDSINDLKRQEEKNKKSGNVTSVDDSMLDDLIISE